MLSGVDLGMQIQAPILANDTKLRACDNKIDRSDAVFKLLRLWVDINGDGSLSTSEPRCVRLSADMKVDGYLDRGELLGVRAEMKSPDDGFYTRGSAMTVSTSGDAPVASTINVLEQRPQTLTVNGPGNAVFAGLDAPVSPVYASLPVAIGFTAVALPAAPGYGSVPASNDYSLRDMDNVYLFGNGNYVAFSASQVKINNSNRTYMIGTDGADNFDSNYYAAYPQYFNNSLLTNFLAGGGNDQMGGSVRYDSLWVANDGEWKQVA
jgi:hypothetical protein